MTTPSRRYRDLPIRRRTLADGSIVTYRARRFVPPAASLPASRQLELPPGARLELFAAEALGDPLTWWAVCDANDAMSATEMELVVGRPLRIPDAGTGVAP